MRIVITDCDHDSVDVERAVARDAGADLVLARCRTEDDVVAAGADADALVVQYAPVTARVLDALPRVRVLSRYGVGVDTLDVPAATARGVAVCNVPDYGTEDVSDHAIALALTLARGTARLDRAVRAGTHSLEHVKPLHRVATRTFGVLGLGRIGAATARKAAGLGYAVVGADPRAEPGTTTAQGVRVLGTEEVVASSDVLSLHLPLTAGTHHLIGEDLLARARPGAVLVNTSRGGVVDTAALVRALRSGRLAGAGLDVFETEPLPRDSELLQLEQVVLTPHAAWYSEESYAELKRRTVRNAVDVLAGDPPPDVLNPEALDPGAPGPGAPGARVRR
ncbi:C-terminal binding protein [Kineococcus sp. SYSU DK005]|uniref:C-terminal binding protein n=1 Tax=Kineococcus sp. SYSU DK005 TaxID=3383126 RepID=UPI003D7CB879